MQERPALLLLLRSGSRVGTGCRMVGWARGDPRRAAALTVLLAFTVVAEFVLLEEVGPYSLAIGLLVAAAGGFFLTGVLFGAGGYVAAAIPTIGFLLLAPLIPLGTADGPWTSDGQTGLVPVFLSLYAAILVAAGHGVRCLWLGARRLRRWSAWKRKPEKPFGPIH